METIKDQDNLTQFIEYNKKKYKCADTGKFKRAIYGMDDSGNPRVPGVGEDADPALLLAAYDRLGGYIQNEEGFKVMNGAFCDYRASRNKDIKATVVIEKPEVILEAKVNGTMYEWEEGDDVPWADLVNIKERKRGEKNARVRVEKPKEVKDEKVEEVKDEKPKEVKDEKPKEVKDEKPKEKVNK